MASAEKRLEKASLLPARGTTARPMARKKLSHVNGLAARGTAAFILPSCCRYLTTTSPSRCKLASHATPRRSAVIPTPAGIAALNATRRGRRSAAEWPSDGPSERRTFARGHEVRRLPDGRSATGRMVVTRPEREDSRGRVRHRPAWVAEAAPAPRRAVRTPVKSRSRPCRFLFRPASRNSTRQERGLTGPAAVT